MSNSKATIQILSWSAHGVAAVVLTIVCFVSPAMTLFCVVPGALIGCASVAAARGRPVPLYCAFGLLMGFTFWMGVSSVNQSDFLGLVFLVVLAGGVVWSLQQPGWPSVVFTSVITLVLLGMVILQYRNRHLLTGVDADMVRRTLVTALGVLAVGLLYLGVGFAEVLMQQNRKRRRVKRRPVEADAEEFG